MIEPPQDRSGQIMVYVPRSAMFSCDARADNSHCWLDVTVRGGNGFGGERLWWRLWPCCLGHGWWSCAVGCDDVGHD